MWVTSQEDPTVEIIHFEGTGLNGLCPNEFFILTEGRLLEGEKEIAYWYMLAVLHSLFLFLILCFFHFVFTTLILFISFLSFLVLTRVV